jgi:hypothetical protein
VFSLREIILIAAGLLATVGVLASLLGHGWELTARLVRFFFDKDLNEHMGERVFKAGLAALVLGIGLLYLMR